MIWTLHTDSFHLVKGARNGSLSELAQFSSVQSLSCFQLFETPWTAACQASLFITNSQSLPKLWSDSKWSLSSVEALETIRSLENTLTWSYMQRKRTFKDQTGEAKFYAQVEVSSKSREWPVFLRVECEKWDSNLWRDGDTFSHFKLLQLLSHLHKTGCHL